MSRAASKALSVYAKNKRCCAMVKYRGVFLNHFGGVKTVLLAPE